MAHDQACAGEAEHQQGLDALEQERAQLDAALKAACRSQTKVRDAQTVSLCALSDIDPHVWHPCMQVLTCRALSQRNYACGDK